MTDTTNAFDHEILVVGAGFAGLRALHHLRGQGRDVHVIEAGTDVGGTWYWNRYPGARVDIESLEYSYSFSSMLDEEWDWTERFATQPEILRYAQFVADRFDLYRDIVFGARVLTTELDESDDSWRLTTEDGDVVTARYCVLASGTLSMPVTPPTPLRLSRMTGWPSSSCIFCPTERPMMSAGPPAGNGTISLIGRVG